jgi:hypothetical protein
MNPRTERETAFPLSMWVTALGAYTNSNNSFRPLPDISRLMIPKKAHFRMEPAKSDNDIFALFHHSL